MPFPRWLTVLLFPLFYRRWVELKRQAQVTGVACETQQVLRIGRFALVINRELRLLP